MIRRAFVRAMSCAILTSLLGVKAWRLEDAEWVTMRQDVIRTGPDKWNVTVQYDTISLDGHTVRRNTHTLRLPTPVPEEFARLIRENVRGESPFAPIIRAARSEP